jgi:hypothetical protein
MQDTIGAGWHRVIGDSVANFLELVPCGMTWLIRGPSGKIQVLATLFHVMLDQQRHQRQSAGIASQARMQYVERKTENTVFQQTLKSIGS